jgi:hypothetical protein
VASAQEELDHFVNQQQNDSHDDAGEPLAAIQ